MPRGYAFLAVPNKPLRGEANFSPLRMKLIRKAHEALEFEVTSGQRTTSTSSTSQKDLYGCSYIRGTMQPSRLLTPLATQRRFGCFCAVERETRNTRVSVRLMITPVLMSTAVNTRFLEYSYSQVPHSDSTHTHDYRAPAVLILVIPGHNSTHVFEYKLKYTRASRHTRRRSPGRARRARLAGDDLAVLPAAEHGVIHLLDRRRGGLERLLIDPNLDER